MNELMNTTLNELLIASQCQALAVRFMDRFDANDAAGLAQLFADDGEWQRGDGIIRGRAALLQMMASRPGNVLLRHVLSNFQATIAGTERCLITSLVTVYRCEFAAECVEPAPFDGPQAVGSYQDEMVRINGFWRIAKKCSTPIFTRRVIE